MFPHSKRTRNGAIAFTLLSLGVGAEMARGQCPEGRIQLRDAFELQLLGKPLVDPNGPAKAAMDVEKEKAQAELFNALPKIPLAVPSATQVEAPANAGGASTVSLPGISSLLALAQEQGLVNSKDGVTSVSLTPYSFLTLVRPEYLWNQELYESTRRLRHWGGTASFGGKGDAIDRDGDGKADEALQAKDFNDIVTWEAKYQLGSRDRRERENFEVYDREITAAGIPEELNRVESDAILATDNELRRRGASLVEECYLISDVAEVFKSSSVAPTLEKVKKLDEAYEEAAKRAFDKIDRKPILTLVFGGTERADGFGPDKRSAALRGAFTWLGGTNSAEASWAQVETLLGGKDPTTLKLGWQYSRNFLKGSQLSKDGVTLAVSGSHEMYNDVPMASHDTVSKVNAKIEIPVTVGVSIPVSVTWANHKDLLTDEDEIQGHVGFTVDYKKVREQLLAKFKNPGT
jgi:hypothetical protein